MARGKNALIVDMLPAMTTVVKYIRTDVLPALGAFKDNALVPLRDFVRDDVVPAVKTLYETVFPALATYITDTLIPAWGDLKDKVVEVNDYLSTTLTATLGTVEESLGTVQTAFEDLKTKALEPLKDYVVDDLVPTLSDLDSELKDTLQPTITATGEVLETALFPKFKLIKTIIDEIVLPALTALWKYFGEDITKVFEAVSTLVDDFSEKALKKIKTVWEEDVKGALEDMRDFIKDDLIPAFDDLYLMLLEKLEPTIFATGETLRLALFPKFELIKTIIEETVLPVLETLWKYLGEDITKVFEAVSTLVDDFAEKALKKIKTVWEEDVQPALISLWDYLTGNLSPAIDTTKEKFNDLTADFAEGADGMRNDTKELSKDTLSDFLLIHQSVDDDLKGPFTELWETVWPLVIETWEEHLKPTFQEIIDFFDADLSISLTGIRDFFIAVWKDIEHDVVATVKTLFTSIETIIGVSTAIIRVLLAIFETDWAKAWEAIKDIGEEIWEGIKGILGAWGVDIEEIWTGIWNGISEEYHRIADPIIGFIQGLINKAIAAKNIISSIGGGIGGVPSAVGSKFGALKSFLGGIPGFADGVQNFGGGPALVGERGPELVNLPRGSSVTPNGAGGNTYVFNFPNYVGNRDDLKRLINDARLEFQRRGN